MNIGMREKSKTTQNISNILFNFKMDFFSLTVKTCLVVIISPLYFVDLLKANKKY